MLLGLLNLMRKIILYNIVARLLEKFCKITQILDREKSHLILEIMNHKLIQTFSKLTSVEEVNHVQNISDKFRLSVSNHLSSLQHYKMRDQASQKGLKYSRMTMINGVIVHLVLPKMKGMLEVL